MPRNRGCLPDGESIRRPEKESQLPFFRVIAAYRSHIKVRYQEFEGVESRVIALTFGATRSYFNRFVAQPLVVRAFIAAKVRPTPF